MSQDSNLIPGAASPEPLNILFVSHDAHPMGAQYLLLTLTSWLKENTLVTPRFVMAGPGTLTDEFLRIGPILRWDAERQAKSTPEVTLRLLRSFCGQDLSAVYLNSAASGHVIEATRSLGVPQIVHVHELEKSIERWVGADKIAALRKYADAFIAASKPVADNLHCSHGIARQKLHVVDAFIKSTKIPPASHAEKRAVKSALGLNPDAKIVLGCGTTDWRKGPDLFVEVAQVVRQSISVPIQFVWVGRESHAGEIKRLEQVAESAGVGKQVKFVGEVTTPLPYMIASDIFLLSSREDPFPLVCMESADCGVPIICFAEAGGMPDFVGTSCGVVVPNLDVQQMAGAVSALLKDEAKTQQLGEQARQKVRNECDVSVKGWDIYEILRSL